MDLADASKCDPNNVSLTPDPNLNPNPIRIPVYAPRGGCADYITSSATVVIRLDRTTQCNTAINNGDRSILLSHVMKVPAIPDAGTSRTLISAGSLVGYLCLDSEYSACNNYQDPSSMQWVPTHLAFQLQYFSGSAQQVPTDLIGYLSYRNCLYDDWAYRQASPATQSAPYKAC